MSIPEKGCTPSTAGEVEKLVERLRKQAGYYTKAGTIPIFSEAAALIESQASEIAATRLQGQDEGFAAAVQWLRDRSAQKPPASLWHAAHLLADQMEQSRIPTRTALGKVA